eukprot:363144_1
MASPSTPTTRCMEVELNHQQEQLCNVLQQHQSKMSDINAENKQKEKELKAIQRQLIQIENEKLKIKSQIHKLKLKKVNVEFEENEFELFQNDNRQITNTIKQQTLALMPLQWTVNDGYNAVIQRQQQQIANLQKKTWNENNALLLKDEGNDIKMQKLNDEIQQIQTEINQCKQGKEEMESQIESVKMQMYTTNNDTKAIISNIKDIKNTNKRKRKTIIQRKNIQNEYKKMKQKLGIAMKQTHNTFEYPDDDDDEQATDAPMSFVDLTLSGSPVDDIQSVSCSQLHPNRFVSFPSEKDQQEVFRDVGLHQNQIQNRKRRRRNSSSESYRPRKRQRKRRALSLTNSNGRNQWDPNEIDRIAMERIAAEFSDFQSNNNSSGPYFI